MGISAPTSLLLTLTIVISHSYILMMNEGVTAQLFALPLFNLALSEFLVFFQRRITWRERGVFAALIGALALTMAEALQLLFAYFLIVILIQLAHKHGRKSCKLATQNISGTAVIAVVCMPLQVIDLLRNFVLRFQQSFRYSGFGIANWEPLSLIFSFPYLSVANEVGLDISKTVSHGFLVTESILLVLVVLCLQRFRPSLLNTCGLAALILMLVIVLTGGSYPLWKFGVFFQPLLLGMIFTQIEMTRLRPLVPIALCVCLGLLAVKSTDLLYSYQKHSVALEVSDFELSSDSDRDQNVVIVTPLTSGLYANLGSTGPFVYANSGWGPRFSEQQRNWNIALFYSCNIEGTERCRAIQASSGGSLDERELRITDDPISRLLGEDGLVDREKLEKYITETFGVSSTIRGT
jgi:hypothetical protein